MHQHIISGTIRIPQEPKQRALYRQLSEFVNWMQRTKDAGEIQKDKRRSVPIAMLPMVF